MFPAGNARHAVGPYCVMLISLRFPRVPHIRKGHEKPRSLLISARHCGLLSHWPFFFNRRVRDVILCFVRRLRRANCNSFSPAAHAYVCACAFDVAYALGCARVRARACVCAPSLLYGTLCLRNAHPHFVHRCARARTHTHTHT